MAILKSQPGIEVTVAIDGWPAPEYDDNDSEHTPPAAYNQDPVSMSNAVIKYIESVTNATFQVRLKTVSTYLWESESLIFAIYVDGHRVMDAVSSDPWTGVSTSRIIKGWERRSNSGHWLLHRFKFANLATTGVADGAKLEANKKTATTLGTIEVRVYRATTLGPDRRVSVRGQVPLTALEALAESSLKGKALTHSTSGGDPEPGTEVDWVNLDQEDEENYPMARFLFRYRSRDALQKLMILPRPYDMGAISPKLIKCEPEPTSRPPPPMPEIIDLTLDDDDDDDDKKPTSTRSSGKKTSHSGSTRAVKDERAKSTKSSGKKSSHSKSSGVVEVERPKSTKSTGTKSSRSKSSGVVEVERPKSTKSTGKKKSHSRSIEVVDLESSRSTRSTGTRRSSSRATPSVTASTTSSARMNDDVEGWLSRMRELYY